MHEMLFCVNDFWAGRGQVDPKKNTRASPELHETGFPALNNAQIASFSGSRVCDSGVFIRSFPASWTMPPPETASILFSAPAHESPWLHSLILTVSSFFVETKMISEPVFQESFRKRGTQISVPRVSPRQQGQNGGNACHPRNQFHFLSAGEVKGNSVALVGRAL